MKGSKYGEVIREVDEYMNRFILPVLKHEVHEMFETYRYGIKIKGEWCCRSMKAMASELWHLSAPPDCDWATQLLIRNKRVMYCPFCGVKL